MFDKKLRSTEEKLEPKKKDPEYIRNLRETKMGELKKFSKELGPRQVQKDYSGAKELSKKVGKMPHKRGK